MREEARGTEERFDAQLLGNFGREACGDAGVAQSRSEFKQIGRAAATDRGEGVHLRLGDFHVLAECL